MMLPELSTHFGPLALHRTACLTVRNQADGFQSHHQHRVLLQAVCIAQGHVVAEQQLPVPASWLQWDEDAMEEAPSPSSSPLQFCKKQQQGHETVLITGANQLTVEVCQVQTQLPLKVNIRALQNPVLATASNAAGGLLWPHHMDTSTPPKTGLAWRRSTLRQAPWTSGLLEVTASLPLGLSRACSERPWTMTWVAVERPALLPGMHWLMEASLAAAFYAVAMVPTHGH